MNIPSWQKTGQFDTIMVSKKDLPMVNFIFIFPFGADRDPIEKQGLTNMTGDLLLRGCKSMNRIQIEDRLDELGGSLNIYTGFHSVSIEGQILKRNFPSMIEIVQEILSASTFAESQLEDLRNETIAQLQLRLDDDQGLAKTAFNNHLFQDHVYSREIVGNAKTLHNITSDDVKEHFKKYFTLDRIKIGFSGDVSNAMIDLSILALSKSLPEKTIPDPIQPVSVQCTGKTLIFVDKPERSQTHFYIGHPTQGLQVPHAYDFLVFKTAFAGSLFQAKYMQEIRVKRGWSYGAYGSSDHRKLASTFYLYTFPKNEDTANAIETSLKLYQQAQAGTLVEQADIDFAKN
ncbi:MAG: insulinase family protein, partial [Deltaproteobacteria bacterium]|nr:insulinase family protein [Deltaproteobacteria bacterium]